MNCEECFDEFFGGGDVGGGEEKTGCDVGVEMVEKMMQKLVVKVFSKFEKVVVKEEMTVVLLKGMVLVLVGMEAKLEAVVVKKEMLPVVVLKDQ